MEVTKPGTYTLTVGPFTMKPDKPPYQPVCEVGTYCQDIGESATVSDAQVRYIKWSF